MSVKIYYNDTDVFSGLAPTPFISRNLSPINDNDRKGLVDSISLDGNITGVCTGDFNSAWGKFNQLLNRFCQNYKTFSLEDGSDIIYKVPHAVIRSINISENKWYGLIPFTIDIDLYNSGFFDSGAVGLLDCENSFDFQENEDCTVTLTHTVRAVGYNTTECAINNALNFVSGQTGWSSQVIPNFMDAPSGNLILNSVAERVNRLAGEAEIIETYTYSPADQAAPNSGILKYQLDYEQSINRGNVSVQGQIMGGRTFDIETLRQTYNNTNFYTLANNFYKENNTSGNLHTNHIGLNITENSFDNSINFEINYTDFFDDSPYLIDAASFTYDCIEDEVCIAYEGEVRTTSACSVSGWQEVKNFYENLDIKANIDQLWARYGSGDINYNNIVSNQYGEDPVNKTIQFNVEYCSSNNDVVDCLENYTYSIGCTPCLEQYRSFPELKGKGYYCIQRLNAQTRAQLNINGSARASDCCTISEAKNILKTQINQLAARHLRGSKKVLESISITEEENRNITFSASWSAEGLDIIPSYLK